MLQNIEEISFKVKTLEKRNPAYGEIVRWTGELLIETVKFSEKFTMPDLQPDQNSTPGQWEQGRSFLNLSELILDWDQAGLLYKRLVDLVGKREDGRKQVKGLLKIMDDEQEDISVLMKAVLSSDGETIEAFSKKFKIDSPVLSLLVKLSLRPFLLYISHTVMDYLDIDRWHYGHCPVCGSAPGLANLSGEGGKRRLHCSLCEATWAYPRLRCPFCETDDSKDLSYLKAENEEGLRVDLCSRCGNYIKTMDLRELDEPIIVPLDDIATWHLDMIAGENMENKGADLARST